MTAQTSSPYAIIDVRGWLNVVYRRAWEGDASATAFDAMKGGFWVADGPFGTLVEAEAARQKLIERDHA